MNAKSENQYRMTATPRNGWGAEASHQQGFSPFVCACFTLNYLIGTGFLTLPWAFQRAGVFLSSLGMILICVVANTGSDYILSAMARAEAISVNVKNKFPREGTKEEKQTENGKLCSEDSIVTESTSLLFKEGKLSPLHGCEPPGHLITARKNGNCNECSKELDLRTSYQPKLAMKISVKQICFETCNCFDEETMQDDKLLIGENKYELTELCQIFLGDTGLKAYGIAVALDIYGFLWAYASVFGAAIAHSFPLFGLDFDSYHIYVLVFSLVVVPMSFLELSEQAAIQVILSGCRIIMILLMVITPLVAQIDRHIPPSSPHFDEQTVPMGAVWCNFSNIHEMIPILVFAVLFHQAVPGLADEMTEKSKIGTVFGLTFVLCGVAYSLIGIVVAWYFGDEVYQSSNINWNSYHAGTGQLVANEAGDAKWVGVAWWARTISVFVVCFPAIDVVSSFPLYAYVLGNSLVGLAYAENPAEVQNNRRINMIYRAIAAIPPIIGALLVRDLGTITDYSGLTGLAIAFCFPALLYIASEEKSKEFGITPRTQYERAGSSKTAAKAMFIFGVITIAFCLILLVAKG